MRVLCFQHKKKSAPRVTAGASTSRRNQEKEGSYCFPFYEDLTKANFVAMRAISDHKDVQSCWSINGQLKFKLIGSTVVKKVKSIYDNLVLSPILVAYYLLPIFFNPCTHGYVFLFSVTLFIQFPLTFNLNPIPSPFVV